MRLPQRSLAHYGQIPLGVVLILLCSYVPAMGQPQPPQSGAALSQMCAAAVTKMHDLKRNLKFPYLANDLRGDPPRVEGDFDVNTYFTVLDQLSVVKGKPLIMFTSLVA